MDGSGRRSTRRGSKPLSVRCTSSPRTPALCSQLVYSMRYFEQKINTRKSLSGKFITLKVSVSIRMYCSSLYFPSLGPTPKHWAASMHSCSQSRQSVILLIPLVSYHFCFYPVSCLGSFSATSCFRATFAGRNRSARLGLKCGGMITYERMRQALCSKVLPIADANLLAKDFLFQFREK